MLRLDGLRKRFGDVSALDGCSFDVAPGQMLGFLGPNGAGKTTAMRSVFGLVRPDEGRVTWQDNPVSQRVRRTFGYMPEERGLYPKMKVREQVVYFGRIHGLDRGDAVAAADRWLEVFDLSDRGDGKLEELSHGNQQRAQLIIALIHDPPVLVLDEPFSGLDPIAAHTMANVLRERADEGAAVLFSSHQLDVVEGLCEDVVIVNAGKVILSGKVNRIRAESPHRYLDVVFEGPFDRSWTDQLDRARIVDRRPDGARLLIDDQADVPALADATAAAGTIAQFVVEPPPLSEIFREVVAP